MNEENYFRKGIPVSVSLAESVESQNAGLKAKDNKKRIVYVSALAVFVGALISVIAKLLVNLINLITNISFHDDFSVAYQSPALIHLVGGLLSFLLLAVSL